MITRSLRLRHGRIAIAKPSTPCAAKQWRRTLSLTTRRAAQPSTEDQADADNITADWEFFQHQRRLTSKVGAVLEPHYKPRALVYHPPRPDQITLELLLAAQTHLGHRTSLWHPANSRYIHGVWGQTHDAIHIISLDVTAAHLRRACKVVEGVAAKGGLILFVGTRDGHAMPVVRAAELAKGYHLFDKWRPGTITNAEQILGKCKKIVVNENDEEVIGFAPQMGVRASIKPDLVVCLNPLENYILLHECGLHNIPTIGIIDTDVNPTWVTYPIPANDDSIRSISVIVGALGRAGEAGQATRRSRTRDGQIDFTPAADLYVPSREDVQQAKRLRDNPEMEDREEDEEELLTAAEEEMYSEPAAPAPVVESSVDESDDAEHVQENDESLVSLTDYGAEESAPLLSQEDREALTESIKDSTDSIQSPQALDNAIEQKVREEAPASFDGTSSDGPVTKLTQEIEAVARQGEAESQQVDTKAKTSEDDELDGLVLPTDDLDAQVETRRSERKSQGKDDGEEKK